MATTRTPGITLARDGRFFIDKRYRGIRIGMRIGAIDQEQAEQRLRTEMAQVDLELARQASRPLFADCVLAECRRPPYPITWEEQDRLFPMLPAHLARMALFAVNTGLRDSNVCGLQWSWEVPVPEIGRSVFVIPAEAVKTKRAHVVVVNDAAWSIVQTVRGQHPVWVFTYRGHPVGTMNNNGWQQARREAGLRSVRVHDLRHTFACRLRAAGVSAEDRAALLGHATQSMVGLMRAPTSGDCCGNPIWF